ncbi:hypothetical protein G7Y89_g8094 [Cudoniella acicularis]|uniref:N-acetyltransferase domain-containing protein n=1 Tax=Cudoniella acicularis TaxID=354080 RepID=A0A8H4W3X1_9HELO|nr:hypothetical protein G7Y89_g8094 [Cudoniella acicularis]
MTLTGSDETTSTSQAQVTLKKVPQIDLVPWDPDSPSHVERLTQQRVACGWDVNRVQKWATQQREGYKFIYWIVLSDSPTTSDPQTASSWLTKHLTLYPTESTPLTPSSPSSSPSAPQIFIPLGHISLDTSALDVSRGRLTYDLPSPTAYRVTTFYVSRSVQGSGIGRLAMDRIEGMASDPKGQFKASVLAISTALDDDEFKKKYSIVEWYARRGYKPYKYVERAWNHTDSNGEEWGWTAIFMKKDISSLLSPENSTSLT